MNRRHKVPGPTEAVHKIRDSRTRGVVGAALIAVSSILSIVVSVDTEPRADHRLKTNAEINIAISVLLLLYLGYMAGLTATSNLKRSVLIATTSLYSIGAAATVVSIGFQSNTIVKIKKQARHDRPA